jgi:hypothetical protein
MVAINLLQVTATTEEIDMELLKKQEPILFHDYIHLYAVRYLYIKNSNANKMSDDKYL